jgi:hypothetical protein
VRRVTRACRSGQRILCKRAELISVEMIAVFKCSFIISPAKPPQQQIHLVVRFLFHLNQNAAL